MATAAQHVEAPASGSRSRRYRIPTATPESDGTLEWDTTTIVVVHVEAGGKRGQMILEESPEHMRRRLDKETPLLLIALQESR